MRNSLKAVLFGAFSVMFSAGLHAETHQHGDMNAASDASVQQVIRSSGVVKAIDMNSKKITISHEAIPAVGWPAMTMRFTFVNADDAIDAINALKTGNHVDFSFIQQGNISLLKSINVTQS
ncbi:TPA: cation efflux system protein CusF [Klebsiella pneumoniae]|nr:cation efflux system protein CusF [Klebsiella pneumoniae]HBQ6523260.1 cation efflux system protein CusF [Klebsiella pneumoniae]HBQ6755150.1 cation efflux system protein CusF [Klebsiella pneumoniae]